jgi:hypothetical protein
MCHHRRYQISPGFLRNSLLTTNQTYTETSTQIIYTWTLLTGQIANGIGFPYFVEGQYNLVGVNQTTSLDTYTATLTSVCGNTISQSGTF